MVEIDIGYRGESLQEKIYGVALIIAGVALVWRIGKGQLNGKARIAMLFAYGCFVLAWVAKTFDW